LFLESLWATSRPSPVSFCEVVDSWSNFGLSFPPLISKRGPGPSPDPFFSCHSQKWFLFMFVGVLVAPSNRISPPSQTSCMITFSVVLGFCLQPVDPPNTKPFHGCFSLYGSVSYQSFPFSRFFLALATGTFPPAIVPPFLHLPPLFFPVFLLCRGLFIFP